MSHENNKIVTGYFPVIHQGYVDLLNKYPGASVGVFDSSIISEFDYLRKDIRALAPEQAVKIINGLGSSARTLSMTEFDQIMEERDDIVMIDDDISRTLVERHSGRNSDIIFESTFLRWDRLNTSTNIDVVVDRTISSNDIQIDPSLLFEEAEQSSDWWRHIAAGLIEDGNLILAHNRAMPHEYVNSIEGDPRITENRGSGIEKSLFIHAEADLVAHMAKKGISTKGKELFVTTFPCPNCAKLIAASGFKACYFVEGYAMLDGQRVLNDAGVEIIKIEGNIVSKESTSRLRSYPEKN